MAEDESPINTGDVIRQRFEVRRSLGSGGYGVVFEVWDREAQEQCAIKVEVARPADNEPGLEVEIAVIKKLQNSLHVTRFKHEGQVGPLRYVIMQLVGKNLTDLRLSCPDSRFSLYTTQRLASQCLDAIRDVHMAGFVHRDIKPANFAMGRLNTDARVVFILDFGLVRQYTLSNGVIRPARSRAGFRGTVRYASANAHKNKDLGRVDDMWSWLYTVSEMRGGSLPWSKEPDRAKVGRIKDSITRFKLLGDLDEHNEFKAIYAHIGKLQFETEPDVTWIARCLQNLATRLRFRDAEPWDWEQGGVAHLQAQNAAVQPYAAQMAARNDVIKARMPGERSD